MEKPKRDQMLTVRLTSAGMTELNRLRGAKSKGQYIRDLLAKASRESRK